MIKIVGMLLIVVSLSVSGGALTQSQIAAIQKQVQAENRAAVISLAREKICVGKQAGQRCETEQANAYEQIDHLIDNMTMGYKEFNKIMKDCNRLVGIDYIKRYNCMRPQVK